MFAVFILSALSFSPLQHFTFVYLISLISNAAHMRGLIFVSSLYLYTYIQYLHARAHAHIDTYTTLPPEHFIVSKSTKARDIYLSNYFVFVKLPRFHNSTNPILLLTYVPFARRQYIAAHHSFTYLTWYHQISFLIKAKPVVGNLDIPPYPFSFCFSVFFISSNKSKICRRAKNAYATRILQNEKTLDKQWCTRIFERYIEHINSS